MTPFRRIVVCIGLAAIPAIGCRTSSSTVTKQPTPRANGIAIASEAAAEASDLRPPDFPDGEAEAPTIELTALDGDAAESNPADDRGIPDTLSLPWLVQEVQRINPSVQAMYAAWQAASARFPQVVSLDDPMFAVTFAPASFDSRDVESAYALEASQKLPWHGKRRLRGEAARWETSGAGFDVTTTQQKLAELAELAFWDYCAVQKQLELNQKNREIMKTFRSNADTRYRTGLVTQQDLLQADIELANLQQRHIELERTEKIASGRINVLIRRHPNDPLPPPSSLNADLARLPHESHLLSSAVARRPEIAAAAARTQAAQAKWALARKEYYPDVEVFGRYDKFWQPTSTQGDLQSQVGVRVNVPVYQGRRDAAVTEAMHQASKARAEYEQLILDVEAEVHAAYEQARESERVLALYSKTLIPAAEQNVALARSNYDVAKINFLDLATAQRQLVEARDRQIQVQVEAQRRAATLRRVAGSPLMAELPPAPAVNTP